MSEHRNPCKQKMQCPILRLSKVELRSSPLSKSVSMTLLTPKKGFEDSVLLRQRRNKQIRSKVHTENA